MLQRFAPLARIVTLAALFATLPAPSSTTEAGSVSPFAALAGRWVGEGRFGIKDNPPESVKCRATYIAGATADELKQTIRCATAGGSIEVISAIQNTQAVSSKASGRKPPHNIAGQLEGEVTAKGFHIVVKGSELAANMDVIVMNNKQVIENSVFQLHPHRPHAADAPPQPGPHQGDPAMARLFGNARNSIVGTSQSDFINGFEGNDSILGGNGNDTIEGGQGNDTVRGGNGNDTIRDLDGNDTISGDDGNDRLFGGNGRDTIRGGNGNDRIFGSDTVDLAPDELFGGNGSDVIFAGNGNDLVDGGNGNDTLKGGEGSDGLLGGNGDDLLDGGSGIDLLAGGAGANLLIGGGSTDVFQISAPTRAL